MQSKAMVLERVKPQVSSRDLMFALCGSLFIALCSQVSIALPFTPVPASLQPQAVLFLAALIGSKRAFLAVSAFLLEGAMGLPVFAEGHAGAIWLAGATGGYLLSYLPVSFAVGYLCETIAKNHIFATGAAMLMGAAFIISLGTAWLACYVGPTVAWSMGAAPFIITDLLKVVMATTLLTPARRFLRGFLESA